MPTSSQSLPNVWACDGREVRRAINFRSDVCPDLCASSPSKARLQAHVFLRKHDIVLCSVFPAVPIPPETPGVTIIHTLSGPFDFHTNLQSLVPGHRPVLRSLSFVEPPRQALNHMVVVVPPSADCIIWFSWQLLLCQRIFASLAAHVVDGITQSVHIRSGGAVLEIAFRRLPQ